MTSHLQQLIDAAMAEQILPLGEAIARAVGGLDEDEPRRAVEAALVQAVVVGLRVAFAEATAQLDEQGVHAELVLDIEAAPPL
jgi:hypothetical protein